MERLRAPGGCPWDREQTHASLAKYLREEAAEVLDAIAALGANDPGADEQLCEELGDLWLQIAFHACLAKERGAFDIHDVEAAVVEKLLRRHPGVFETRSSVDADKGGRRASAEDAEQALLNWQRVKNREKAGRMGQSEADEPVEAGLLDNLPSNLPSLDQAMEIGHLCARAGFEWPTLDGVLDKVKEEIAELQAESSLDRVEAEFGDVLFSLVQWARRKKIDPDLALRRQMQRFRQRFKYVEARAREAGGWEKTSLEQMEMAWKKAKSRSGEGRGIRDDGSVGGE